MFWKIPHDELKFMFTEKLFVDLVFLCSKMLRKRFSSAHQLNIFFSKIQNPIFWFFTLNISWANWSSSSSLNFLRQTEQNSGKKTKPSFAMAFVISITSCSRAYKKSLNPFQPYPLKCIPSHWGGGGFMWWTKITLKKHFFDFLKLNNELGKLNFFKSVSM